MKKVISVRVLVISVISVFIITIGVAFLLFNHPREESSNTKAEILDLRYGDEFSGFEFFDENDNELNQLPQSDKSSIVFYVSASCNGCKEAMDNYDRIQIVFGDQFNYYCMWLSEIPSNASEKYRIENSYALKSRYMFATSTPSVFLISPENTVDFVSSEMGSLIDKLLSDSTISQDQLKQNALDYILNRYSQNTENPNQLIYFSMEGCPDCKAADEIINQSDKLKKYEITRIYYKNATEKALTTDDFDLFQKVFGIEWYPSFYVINDFGEKFVGEVPVEKLEEILCE